MAAANLIFYKVITSMVDLEDGMSNQYMRTIHEDGHSYIVFVFDLPNSIDIVDNVLNRFDNFSINVGNMMTTSENMNVMIDKQNRKIKLKFLLLRTSENIVQLDDITK